MPPLPPTLSRYAFAEPSADWPLRFEEEAARLRGILGDELVAVHHVGSTSVPGLAAKPIIDMLPIVRSLGRLEALTPAMEEAGYRAWGEYGLPGRRYFTRDEGEWRTHNLHSYQEGDPDIDRHLAFPAYLRAHPEVTAEYAALKREVYARHPADISAYSDGKDAFIKRIEAQALAWYRARPR